MNRVYVDSGGWLSVLIRTDKYHQVGTKYYEAILQRRTLLVTSDYVLDETITRLRYDVGHDAAKQFLELIEKATTMGALEIVFTSEAIWNKAKQLFLLYADVRLSFTDCVSFAIIQQMNIPEVFGYDTHFGLIGVSLQPTV